IREKQTEIARVQLDEAIKHAEDRIANLRPNVTQRERRHAAEHLEHLQRLLVGLRDDAPYQKPFLWPVNFSEIFDRGGFDVVVANPPYVRQESLDAIEG